MIGIKHLLTLILTLSSWGEHCTRKSIVHVLPAPYKAKYLALSAWGEYYARKGMIYIFPDYYKEKSLSATYMGDSRLLNTLLSNGLKFNTLKEFEDALDLAVSNNDNITTELLLVYGINNELKSITNGRILIEKAISNDSLIIVNLFIKYGVDIHSLNQKNQTLIHAAAKFNKIFIAELLLSYQVNYMQKDLIQNKTPLDFAIAFDYVEMQNLLKRYPDLLNKTRDINLFNIACENGYYGLLKFLLRNGAKPTKECLEIIKSKYYQQTQFTGNENDQEVLNKVTLEMIYKHMGNILVQYLRFFESTSSDIYKPISHVGCSKIQTDYGVPSELFNRIAWLAVDDSFKINPARL